LLVAGGAVNTWYLVGDVPALVGTSYGRLLLAKLALFAAMLVLAMANRWYLSLRVAQGERAAARLIRRNAIGEIVLGIGVLAIVGFLGVTPPAIHETPVWPFAHSLTFARVEQSAWLQMALAAGGLLACVATGITLAGLRHRRQREWAGGLAGIVALAVIFVPLLAVPAYPSTYWSSPIRYTTDAIVNGSTLYASHCLGCHGVDDLTADPSGRAPSASATDPSDHALRHSDGDHFWWISHGIPGTAMPGFGSRLTEMDVWYLIEFLHAQVEAQEATAMTDRIKPLRAIVAPDFTFEAPGRPQESLRDLRGREAVLLVLYALPQSLPRLRLAKGRATRRGARHRVASPSRAGLLPEDLAAVANTTRVSLRHTPCSRANRPQRRSCLRTSSF
jgi:mono/diheme cytochrome c family protein